MVRIESLALIGCVLALACQKPLTTLVTRELAIQLDARGCPSEVVPVSSACTERGKACISKRNDRVRWTGPEPFEIHFDPLRGPTIQSDACGNSQCKTAWVTIDSSAPPRASDAEELVEYRYTIVVEGCAQPLSSGVSIVR